MQADAQPPAKDPDIVSLPHPSGRARQHASTGEPGGYYDDSSNWNVEPRRRRTQKEKSMDKKKMRHRSNPDSSSSDADSHTSDDERRARMTRRNSPSWRKG